jgi:hypothetical protein
VLPEAQEDKASFAAQTAKIPPVFRPPPNPFPNLIFQSAGRFKCADIKFFFRMVVFYSAKVFVIHDNISI